MDIKNYAEFFDNLEDDDEETESYKYKEVFDIIGYDPVKEANKKYGKQLPTQSEHREYPTPEPNYDYEALDNNVKQLPFNTVEEAQQARDYNAIDDTNYPMPAYNENRQTGMPPTVEGGGGGIPSNVMSELNAIPDTRTTPSILPQVAPVAQIANTDITAEPYNVQEPKISLTERPKEGFQDVGQQVNENLKNNPIVKEISSSIRGIAKIIPNQINAIKYMIQNKLDKKEETPQLEAVIDVLNSESTVYNNMDEFISEQMKQGNITKRDVFNYQQALAKSQDKYNPKYDERAMGLVAFVFPAGKFASRLGKFTLAKAPEYLALRNEGLDAEQSAERIGGDIATYIAFEGANRLVRAGWAKSTIKNKTVYELSPQEVREILADMPVVQGQPNPILDRWARAEQEGIKLTTTEYRKWIQPLRRKFNVKKYGKANVEFKGEGNRILDTPKIKEEITGMKNVPDYTGGDVVDTGLAQPKQLNEPRVKGKAPSPAQEPIATAPRYKAGDVIPQGNPDANFNNRLIDGASAGAKQLERFNPDGSVIKQGGQLKGEGVIEQPASPIRTMLLPEGDKVQMILAEAKKLQANMQMSLAKKDYVEARKIDKQLNRLADEYDSLQPKQEEVKPKQSIEDNLNFIEEMGGVESMTPEEKATAMELEKEPKITGKEISDSIKDFQKDLQQEPTKEPTKLQEKREALNDRYDLFVMSTDKANAKKAILDFLNEKELETTLAEVKENFTEYGKPFPPEGTVKKIIDRIKAKPKEPIIETKFPDNFRKYQNSHKLEFLNKKHMTEDGLNPVFGNLIENGGDIGREISKWGDPYDFKSRNYIFEKLNSIKDKLFVEGDYKRWFMEDAKKVSREKEIVDEYIKNYEAYPEKNLTPLEIKAKELTISIAKKDIVMVKKLHEEFIEMYKKHETKKPIDKDLISVYKGVNIRKDNTVKQDKFYGVLPNHAGVEYGSTEEILKRKIDRALDKQIKEYIENQLKSDKISKELREESKRLDEAFPEELRKSQLKKTEEAYANGQIDKAKYDELIKKHSLKKDKLNPRYEAYLKTTEKPSNVGMLGFISDMRVKYNKSIGAEKDAEISEQESFTKFINIEVSKPKEPKIDRLKGITKDTENIVKRVNESIQYHGSDKIRDNLKITDTNITNAGNTGSGVHFTPHKAVARRYGKALDERMISIKNPLIIEKPLDGTKEEFISNIDKVAKDIGVESKSEWSGTKQMSRKFADEFREKAMDAGYDSAVTIIPNGEINEVVLYEPEKQIIKTKAKKAPIEEPSIKSESLINISPDDIDFEVAKRAYHGTSFSPEKRAKQEQKDYVSVIQDIHDELVKKTKETGRYDELKEQLVNELEIFKKRLVDKYTDYLRHHAGIMSTMITGAGNFPVRQMNKKNEVSHKKVKDLLDFQDNAVSKIEKKLGLRPDTRIISGSTGVIDKLATKIETLENKQQRMKDINKAFANKDTMNLTEVEEKEVLDNIKFGGGNKPYPSYSLTNNGANIRRLKQRLASETKKSTVEVADISFDGGVMVSNKETNRLQLVFDEKPSDEMRAKLKARGFRWSPRYSAWQRQLTNSAKHDANNILGNKIDMSAKETESDIKPYGSYSIKDGKQVRESSYDLDRAKELISHWADNPKKALEQLESTGELNLTTTAGSFTIKKTPTIKGEPKKPVDKTMASHDPEKLKEYSRKKSVLITETQKKASAKKIDVKKTQIAITDAKDAKGKVHQMIIRRRSFIDLKSLETNEFVHNIDTVTTKLERELIPFLIEKTGVPTGLKRPKLEELMRMEGKSPKLTKITEQVKKHFDEGWAFMKSHNGEMDVEQIENYVTHIWDIPVNKKKVVTSWFATKNKFLKKRFIETIKDGVDELGLQPKILDIGDIIKIHDAVMHKVIANKKFVDDLMKLRKFGVPLIERQDKAPDDWVFIDHPALRKVLIVPSETKFGEKISPELQDILNELGVAIGRRISPVAFGKPVSKKGEYRWSEKEGTTPEIRLQRFFKTKTVAHEIGHHIDKALGLGQSFSDSYKNELLLVNDERIKLFKGTGKESYAESKEEQIAEFFAFLFTKPKWTMNTAPNASADALNRLRKDDVLTKLVDLDFEADAKNLIEEQVSKMIYLPVKIHPDLEKPIKVIFNSIDNSAVGKAIDNVNGILKKMQLSLSLFHHGALTETAVAISNPFKAIGQVLNSKDAVWKNVELAKDAVYHGLQLGASKDIPVQKIQDSLNTLKLRTKNIPIVNLLTKGLAGFNEGWDRVLWEYLHDGLKLYGYEHLASKMPLDTENVYNYKRELAQFINDTYGGQNWDILMVDPRMVQMMSRALLSPDWQFSTIRQALSPLGIGSTNPEMKKLRRKLGRNFWGRVLLYYGVGINMLNYMLYAYSKKDEESDEPVWKRGRFMWDNAYGHKTHLFAGHYKDGQERYIRWGKQFRELVEFIIHPIKKLGGKASPFLTYTAQVFTGKSLSGFESADLRNKYTKIDRAMGLVKLTLKLPFPFSTRSLFDKDKEFFATDLMFPSSKGMSVYRARSLFKEAIRTGDENMVAEVFQDAVENGLDAYSVFKSALSVVKSDYTKSINATANTIDETRKQMYNAKNSKDKAILKRRLKRLIKEKLSREKGNNNLRNAIKELDKYKKSN